MTTTAPSGAPVLVLGVTGKTGAAVAHALLARGIAVRGTTRQPAGGRGLGRAPMGVELVQVDAATGAGLDDAVAGVGAIHHSAPNLSVDEVPMLARTIAAAHRAGVGRVVFHSVMHPYVPTMAHHLRKAQAEHLLRTSGLGWTILQPAAYFQNLLGSVLAGHLSLPYSLDRTFTNVDLRDVAEASATVLLDEAHLHATYELAGPDELDAHTMAAQARVVLGFPVAAARTTAPATNDPATKDPASTSELRAMFDYYDAHGFVGSPHVLAMLLGRRPTWWSQFLADMAPQIGRPLTPSSAGVVPPDSTGP